MPSDFGISTLITDEWARFMLGLDTLADGAQKDARARAVRRDPRTADVRQINIPGWDDIIHVVPQPRATAEEKDAHYAAKRRGDPSPLHPDLEASIDRRSRKVRAIQASASPAYAQAYGQVMTALDNVQDLVTTVATVGRLVVNPAIRVAALAGTSRFASVAVAGRVGATLGLRAIPVLGWVLTAADLMKLVTQIGMLAFPAYALACGGPRAAAAALIPALLMGPALCKPIGSMSKINPFSRRNRLIRSRLARSWRPTIPNLIEVAQTTDALFGVGLSVGAVVGTIQDAAFGAEQRLRGNPVEVNTTQFTESMHRIFSGRLAQETGAALHDLRTAATTLAYGVTLHGTQEDFTLGEHIESLIATTAAVSTLEPYLMAPELEEAMELALDADLEPPIYLERELRADLELEGVPWPAERRWPLPGAPRTITGDSMMQMGATLIPVALADLLRPRRDEVVSTFVGALVNQLVERSAIWLTGSDDAIQYQDAAVYQIMTSLALTNRWPNVGAGEAKIQLFFELAENHMAYSARNSLSASELDLLATRSGITLLRGGPPDTPYPQGFGT
jgi:hypothetical protein